MTSSTSSSNAGLFGLALATALMIARRKREEV
jgi:LPXTG-motif cell wall-anchored protein